MKILKYIFDYSVLVLSILGSIASIIAICFQDIAIEASIAILTLGILLFISMCHDWYFAYKYRQIARYSDICSELNTANSQIRYKVFNDVQGATDLLSTYCESISTIFSTLKGHRIGVCVKLLVDNAGRAEVITQARDMYSKSHNRKTCDADTTQHLIESNTDFSSIYNNVEGDIGDFTYFHSPNLPNEDNYRNSRLNNWRPKNIPFLPNSLTRKLFWPLAYKSTIVVPIFPLDSDLQRRDNLRGFLCIDSTKTNIFNIPIDKEILRGLAAELCPIIDRLMEIMNNG